MRVWGSVLRSFATGPLAGRRGDPRRGGAGVPSFLPPSPFFYIFFFSLFFNLFLRARCPCPSRAGLGRAWQGPKRGQSAGVRMTRDEDVPRCGSPGIRKSRGLRVSKGVCLPLDCRCPGSAGAPGGCCPVPGAMGEHRGEEKG